MFPPTKRGPASLYRTRNVRPRVLDLAEGPASVAPSQAMVRVEVDAASHLSRPYPNRTKKRKKNKKT